MVMDEDVTLGGGLTVQHTDGTLETHIVLLTKVTAISLLK